MTLEAETNRSALNDITESEAAAGEIGYDIEIETDDDVYGLNGLDTEGDTLATSGTYTPNWQEKVEISLPKVELGLDLEAAQALQTEGHELPFVADKETLGRAFINHNKSNPVKVEVTFKAFRVTGSGSQKIGSRTVTFEAPPGNPDRTNLDESANLELPAAWTKEGSYFLKATVRPVSLIEVNRFGDSIDAEFYTYYDTYDPIVHRIRVNNNTAKNPSQVTTNRRDFVSGGFTDSYPIANARFFDAGWETIGARGTNLNRGTLRQDLDSYAIRIRTLHNYADIVGIDDSVLPPSPDQVYGFIPTRGLSDPPWGGGPGNAYASFGSFFEITMAHEINHNLGNNTWSRHVNATQSPTGANGCGAPGTDSTWNNLFNDDDIHNLGWQPGDGVFSTNTGDFMTYCRSRWISDYRWKRLHDRLQNFQSGQPVHPELQSIEEADSKLPPSDKAILGTEGPTIRLITGTLTENDAAIAGTLEPTFEQPGHLEGEISNRSLDSAEAFLRIYRTDTPVQRIDLKPTSGGIKGHSEFESSSFSVPVRDNGTIERIELVRVEDNQVIDSLSGTDWELQTADIETPSRFNRDQYTEFTIEVDATNANGENLHKRLLYSPNPDENIWYPYGPEFTGSTAKAMFTELPGGSEARFLVLISDGLTTRFETSSPFEVKPLSPEVTIDRNERWETTDSEGQPPDEPASTEVVNVATPIETTVGAPVSVDATPRDEFGRSLSETTTWKAIDTETGRVAAVDSGVRFTHAFDEPGTYQLQVKTVDPRTSLNDSDSITVRVSPPPLPDKDKTEAFVDAFQSETSRTITVPNASAAPGQPTQVGITLDAVPNGLQAYNITVSLSDPAVADISDVSAGAISGNGFQVVAQSADSITFRGADIAGTVQTGAGPVDLGTVTLNGTAQGSTTVDVTVQLMEDDQGAPMTPAIEPGTFTAAFKGTTSVKVILAGAPNGLQTYEVRVEGPAVASITDVTPELITGNGFQLPEGGVGETFVTGRAADIVGAVGSFSDSRTLYTIEFNGEFDADQFSVTVTTLTDDNEEAMQSDRIELKVSAGSPFDEGIGGGQAPPKDPDGDGLFEDVDGDGQTTFGDAIALAFIDSNTLTETQLQALDFDNDGNLDFSDAIELAFSL